jgi:hypothetical protein
LNRRISRIVFSLLSSNNRIGKKQKEKYLSSRRLLTLLLTAILLAPNEA